MKHPDTSFALLVTAIILLTIPSACKEDPQHPLPEQPELKLAVNEIRSGAEGGTLVLEYTLIHPLEGATIQTSAPADWITDIDRSVEGEISFSILPNRKKESRETRLTLLYPEIDPAPSCRIIQEGMDTPPYEKEDILFDFEISVHRAAVHMKIMPMDFDGAYYFNLLDGEMNQEDATTQGHELWMQTVETLKMYGYNARDIVNEFCFSGTVEDTWELKADQNYTAVAFAVDPGNASPISNASTEKFRTESISPSDNVIGISIDRIRSRSFEVTAAPSNEDPYFSATVRSDIIEDLSDKDIIDYMLSVFTAKTARGAYTETVSGLCPQTSYTVIMFGLEGGVVTTGLYREEATTLVATDSQGSIRLEFGEYYDIAAVIGLAPELDYLASYGDAFLIIDAITEPEDIPAELCYFGILSLDDLEEAGIEPTEDYIIDSLLLYGTQQYKDKAFGFYYGERLVGAAIIMDENGNLSQLWQSEPFTLDASGVSDPQGMLDWMHGTQQAPERRFTK